MWNAKAAPLSGRAVNAKNNLSLLKSGQGTKSAQRGVELEEGVTVAWLESYMFVTNHFSVFESLFPHSKEHKDLEYAE